MDDAIDALSTASEAVDDALGMEAELDALTSQPDDAEDALRALSDLESNADEVDRELETHDAARASAYDEALDALAEEASSADGAESADDAPVPGYGVLVAVAHVSERPPQLDAGMHPVLKAAWSSRVLLSEHFGIAQAKQMLDSSARHLATCSVEAKDMDIDRKQLRSLKTLSAAAAHEYEVQMWKAIERDVCNAKVATGERRFDLKFYIEAQEYDGVDLDLLTTSRASRLRIVMAERDDFISGSGGECGGVLLPVPDAAEDGPALNNVGSTKVLQTCALVAMGFRTRSRGRWFILFGHHPVPLQLSDRSTGETLFRMLEKQCAGTDEMEGFERKIRNTCTDRYSPNPIAEEALLKKRGASWTGNHTYCHGHIASGGHKEVRAMFQEDTAGLNALARALNAAGEMDKFRTSFAKVLWDKLALEDYAPLNPEAVQFKADLWRAVAGDDARLDAHFRSQRQMIECTCEGDWRNPKFTVFNRPGLTKQRAFTLLMKFYAPEVVGHAPFVYTKKFTGSEKTYCDFLVLDGIHDMLRPTMVDYMVTYHSSEIQGVPTIGTFALLVGEAAPPAPAAHDAAGAEEQLVARDADQDDAGAVKSAQQTYRTGLVLSNGWRSVRLL